MGYVPAVPERHSIWVQRQYGLPGPWTDDPVLANSKFTNVFRVLDRGSQYLLTEILQPNFEQSWIDAAFGAWMYRFTNRPEPWVKYIEMAGHAPRVDDLTDGTMREAFETIHAEGGPIFSPAYRIIGGPEYAGRPKIEWLVDAAHETWLNDQWTMELLRRRADAEAMIETFSRTSRVGPFMSMQVITDIGYVDPEYDENAYVVEGPGSIIGARHVGVEPKELFRRSYEHWLGDGSVHLDLPDGRRYTPSLMDVQNTYCEFGKYIKRSLTNLKSPYKPVGPADPPVLPQHW